MSPDGQWVAFWARGAVRKVPIGGGPVTDVASAAANPPNGLVWDSQGTLFLGLRGRIWQVPPAGPPAAVTTVGDAELGHILPCPLPRRDVILYTVRKRATSWGDEEVVAQMLGSGERTVLPRDAVDARYVPTGHLVFLRRGQLFGVPFDAERLQVGGTPVAVLDEVAQALSAGSTADVTGRWEVWVRPHPGSGPGEQVSTDGGCDPAWHPSGRELFFLRFDVARSGAMMAVDVVPGSPPRMGRPRTLFEFDDRAYNFYCKPLRCVDVSPDGQRFYGVQTPTPKPPPVVTHINLIQNWFEELKAKAPTGR